MANLIVDVRRILHRVSDFIAQKPAKTLPQIMELFFNHGLGDSERDRQTLVRDIAAIGGQKAPERLKQPEPAFALAFFPEPVQGVIDNGHSPTQIEQVFGRQGLGGLVWDCELRGCLG